MKMPLLISTLLVSMTTLPVCADIDWVGNYTDSVRFRQQIERGQQGTRKPRKSTTNKNNKQKVVAQYPKVEVNGKPLQSSLEPVSLNGHTFVPMRSLFTALGFTVKYDGAKRLITATRSKSVMQISLPGSAGTTQGIQQSFETGETPFIHNGVTMLPLRKVSETVGAKVGYSKRSGMPLISITE